VRFSRSAICLLFGLLLLPVCLGSAFAQQERQYDFDGVNGRDLRGGLIFDATGSVYGNAYFGGSSQLGLAYELSPAGNKVNETVLHNFAGNGDGANPIGDLAFDNAGNLYGVTQFGGAFGLGTVFELSPPSVQGGEWTEAVLYSFQGIPSDGAQPVTGLVLDGVGNLYGTTSQGGVNNGYCDGNGGCGTVFELSPQAAPGGNWTETVIYFFQGFNDGFDPLGAMIFDQAGNLYGTTFSGGGVGDGGTVFELSPPSQSGGNWTETLIYTDASRDDAGGFEAGVTLGPNGALFGASPFGGLYGQGTVFRLKPPSIQGGAWAYSTLHNCTDSDGEPRAGVTIANAILYGSTHGSANTGFVFQISSTGIYTSLYDFGADVSTVSRPVFHNGYLYGTTEYGGYRGENGTAFQLRP
jgi:uncharacterized repeat protein (TIGR03803 family)